MLKKETRILGLSASKENPSSIVGTVFRGCLWLDAIVTYAPNNSNERCASGLAVVLRRTKQYSQIQAAIFSREDILPHKYDDFKTLSRLVRFPVFVINESPQAQLPKSEFMQLRLGKNRISLWINDFDPKRAGELYVLGCNEDQHLPESVRVAELIANQL